MMTSESTAPSSAFDPRDWLASLRAGLAVMLKVAMGGLVVIAAGILAVALAMVGMILAAVAVTYRIVSGAPEKTVQEPSADGDGMILEARRTAHGWTVE